MKLAIVILSVVVLVVVNVIAKPADDKYTTKYDDIDLNEILSSERLLKSYVDCLLSKGKCSPEGSVLKRHLPEALETECAKCSDKQKDGTRTVIKFLVEKRKDLWDEVIQIYDPEAKYKKKYEDLYAKEIGK